MGYLACLSGKERYSLATADAGLLKDKRTGNFANSLRERLRLISFLLSGVEGIRGTLNGGSLFNTLSIISSTPFFDLFDPARYFAAAATASLACDMANKPGLTQHLQYRCRRRRIPPLHYRELPQRCAATDAGRWLYARRE